MSNRRTRKGRGGMAAAAIIAGLVLTVAGCSGSGGSDDEGGEGKSTAPAGRQNTDDGDGPSQDEGEPLAELKGSDDIQLTITAAEREEGGFVTLSGTVRNSGTSAWSGVEWKSDENEIAKANPASVGAARLVDKKGKKRYYVLRDTEGRCLCTSFKGGLLPGKSKTWFAQFPAPPQGNDKVDFQLADLPAAGITISGE
ncbi:hypothetical protein [Streptomyces boncukensis]|uniref:Secreted protein n=1 Tax=Streptomyces boncukensis TaxID=2711219 RepID=A0A6G4X1A7_9ACTN|nr:hypothetical protein [Streptomyces boncukensis]NGO70670.1 hypothetical protein [Streptomyces boncukensis]